MMTDTGFLKSLMDFEKDGLTERQVKQVKAYMKADFTPDSVASIPQAGAGLLKWVYAIVNYYGVAKTVNPKRQAVAQGEKMLRAAQKDLTKIKAEVEQLATQLAKLNEDFEKGSAEEKELSDKAAVMAGSSPRRTKLIGGLGSERTRWTADMQTLSETRDFLVGDCLLAAAFLSYTGAFNFEFRKEMLKGDVGDRRARQGDRAVGAVQAGEAAHLRRGDRQVAGEGLPQDGSRSRTASSTRARRATRSASTRSSRRSRGSRRRRRRTRSRSAPSTTPTSSSTLEIAVNLGFAFLFEGVDEYIDPIIDYVLEKNLVKRGNARTVKIGDKDVEWDDSFRLCLDVEARQPALRPEIFGKVMIINYSVTLNGLEDQLLGEVVPLRARDLAEQKEALVVEVAELAGMLKELEDTLLFELANSTGNILDNTDLIETLEKTKTKATEISDKLEEAKSTSIEIDETCAAYRPVAKRGSIMFFVMSSLSTLNNMYELSLALYMVVFLQSLERAEPDSMIENRLENIINQLTRTATTTRAAASSRRTSSCSRCR